MIKTISFSDFTSEFHRMGRGNEFTHAGLKAIFDHMEIIDPSYDLDVIELCCMFSEYDEEELKNQYGYLVNEDSELDELLYELEGRTTVLRFDDKYIIGEF